MVRKADIGRLFAKGLSGREAGRLVLAELLGLERGRDGFLADKDIEALRACLRNTADGDDYKRLMNLYRAVGLMIAEAQIASLQSERFLCELAGDLERYQTAARVRWLTHNLPLIVSEPAYRARKSRQRVRLAARLYSLAEVMEARSSELLGGPDKAAEATEAQWADASAAAERELAELITAGRLTPLRLGHDASLFTVAEARRAQALDREDLVELSARKPERAASEAYEAAYRTRLAASFAQGDLSEGHDVSPYYGEVAAQDEERLLHYYLSGEQLYGADLPEWRRWIDEFKTSEEGDDSAGGVAVIREQGIGEIDKDGRYESYWLTQLEDVLDIERREKDFAASSRHSLAELLASMLAAARASAGVLLAYRQVIEEASAVAGVSFLGSWLGVVPPEFRALLPVEEGDDLLAALQLAAKSYNVVVKQVTDWGGESDAPRLATFEFAELKPDEATVAILRERIALGVGRTGLGADWWRKSP
jgi:hypothetical protein